MPLGRRRGAKRVTGAQGRASAASERAQRIDGPEGRRAGRGRSARSQRRPHYELGTGVACGVLGLSLLTATGGAWTRALGAAAAPSMSSVPAPPPAAAPEMTPRPSPAEFRKHATDVASYDIHARLDTSKHTVTATATIRWTNASSKPQRELYLHLYMNAFKNDRSLFLRSPFGTGRDEARARTWGYIDVKKLVVDDFGKNDVWPGATATSPDDANDQTDIRVPLPQPVQPGQTITLETEFVDQLPEVVERTGYAGTFYFVGQWFPKIARLSPDGAWVHFRFNPLSEFYADFGHYAVTLDVPSNMVVGATGVRVADRRTGDRRVLRYAIEGVHDFAWAAWDHFLVKRARVAGVSVRLLYPPGNEANADRELDAVRFCLPRYDRLYGDYPYPVLTLVHPPEDAANAGGMEYPTLIATGAPWYAPYVGARDAEVVTVHELGHQWFYGLVATNEHRWPFLDEGLNTFAELASMRAHYGAGSLVDLFGLRIGDDELQRAVAARYGHDQIVALPAGSFRSFASLGALVYSRTGTIMDTLARVYGEARVQAALGRYARRYRFAHPGPQRFLGVMREALGDQAADNLEKALFHRGWVDYVARGLQSTPVSPPAGVFDSSTGRRTLPRLPAAEPKRWTGRVLVFRHGTLVFPVDVELITQDGGHLIKHWDGQGNSTSIDYEGMSPLVAAVIDPERRVAIDENQLNNAVSMHLQAPRRSLERATYYAELALGALGP
jgi:Peptidase family M1 domain